MFSTISRLHTSSLPEATQIRGNKDITLSCYNDRRKVTATIIHPEIHSQLTDISQLRGKRDRG
jgi:hypothetical protein